MITHGVKGSTLGGTTLFGDHMVFRANGVGIGRRTAEHKVGRGGGGYGKLREESQKCYGALRRENDSVILQTLVKIWKTEMFFFSVAKRSDTS